MKAECSHSLSELVVSKPLSPPGKAEQGLTVYVVSVLSDHATVVLDILISRNGPQVGPLCSR